MTESWLVTGAAGFIGSNVCAYLRDRGHSVRGYDNFSEGTHGNIERVARMDGGAFSMIEGDIRDAREIQAAVDGCDVVIHLAAQVSIPKSIEDPISNDSVNSAGFLNTFLAAGNGGTKRFVYASSCAVYGDNPSLPLREEETPRPLSPYAATKVINEQYAQTLSSRFPDMSVVGLRFFNIFGPWQPFDGGYASVIPKWIRLMSAGHCPEIYGDGSATRDFCHVDNVCAAIRAIGTGAERPRHSIYNVCSGSPTSIKDLFSIIDTALSSRTTSAGHGKLVIRPPRHGDILHSVGTFSRAEADWGYRPRIGLRDGIDHILSLQYSI